MSRIQLNPSVVTAYPNDEILFTAQWTPPPAGWAEITDDGDITSDFSLFVVAPASQTSGFGVHRLTSGIGFAEWTIDDNFRPTSTGKFIFTGHIFDVVAFEYKYRVEIGATNIVIKDEASVTLTTISYSTLSGDAYRLEMSGGGFRLSRNGTSLHSRLSLPTQLTYPMRYSAMLVEPHAAVSRMLPPRLIGDGWRLGPVVDFTTPSHGSLSTTGPALSTAYFGGTVPGTYSLLAAISAASDLLPVQQTTATIEIPPLLVLGNIIELTLNPGEKIKLKTNYDSAQTPDLVEWSVVSGGGSFNLNEYTADTEPGTSVIRATAAVNDQVADITVTVPAVITPNITAAGVSDVVDWVTNLSSPTWSASAGVIDSAIGLWRAPDQEQKVRITATDGVDTVNLDIEVLAKFPLSNFSAPFIVDRRKTVLIATAEDGSRTSRVKDSPFDSFEVKFENVELADELPTVRDFWDQYYPNKACILENKAEKTQKVVFIDSDLHYEIESSCAVNIALRFRERQ